MKEILDKIVTWFFVIVLGILWYSTKRNIKPNEYTIVIYDVFGKQVKTNEIRVNFKTQKVAQSYILEYQKNFPHYNFSINTEIPEIKN